MESRVNLDVETDVPLSAIDFAPWNPKDKIHGVYRRGLGESLAYFGARDRLKLWPNPRRKGRYICLDGNQRIDVILEGLLESEIRRHFNLEESQSTKAIKEDSANSKVLTKLAKQVVHFKIPSQIMTRLDAETPLTEADAKLFTLTYNRNAARYDEVKHAFVFKEILIEKMKSSLEENHKAISSRLKAMVRPEIPAVQPIHQPSADQKSFEFAEPGSFTPTEAEPFGPCPPAPTPAKTAAPAFIPVVFAFSPAGYDVIMNSVLKSKSRIFRENTLKSALEKLERLTTDDLDSKIDSAIVEIASRILALRIEEVSNKE